MLDYSEIIETDLETRLKQQLVSGNTGDNVDWSVARFYGQPNVEGLAMFLYTKIEAGVPSVFVSVDNISFEDMDTVGTLTRATFDIRVMVAANIVKDRQIQRSNRFVNTMVQSVLTALVGHEVTIDGVEWNYRVSGINNLFRIKNMDAKQINLQIDGVPIDV